MLARGITGEAGASGQLETTFIYDNESRPFEVQLQSVKTDELVFDRDLLGLAYANPGQSAGIGRIRFLVSGAFIYMSLVMTSYIYTVSFPAEQVEAFLAETFELVPFGRESMDIDALLDDFYNDKI